MGEIPQPAPTAYEAGDHVRIYLAEDDVDAHHHGTVCEVIEDQPDELADLTGREMDNHHYRLRSVDEDRELSTSFRHDDLVSVEGDE